MKFVHGELIQSFETNLQLIETNSNKMMKQFQQFVDQAPNAILHESYLRQITKDIQKISHETLEIYSKEQEVKQKISDIVILSKHSIQPLAKTVNESKKEIEKAIESLYEYDEIFRTNVLDCEQQLNELENKITKRTNKQSDISTVNLASISALTTFEDGSLGNKIDKGLSNMRHIVTGLNSADKKLFSLYQAAILIQLDRKSFIQLYKTGQHSFTLAQYRRFNNILRFSPYRMSTKEFMYNYRLDKSKGFPKGKLDSFKKIAVPFGKNRGKLAMKREFDRLFGLEKYAEFKYLKTKPQKIKSMTKTFYNKLAGDKITTTRNIIKNTQWNKPKTFMRSAVTEFNRKTKDLNMLGKGVKAVNSGVKLAGKGLGVFGAALHVRENVNQFRGDNQKVIVGSTVDIAAGSVSTAIGAAVGSTIIPPIDTVVGAAVGAGLSTLFHTKLPFGKPPKSPSEYTKDAVNGAVDGVKSGIDKMGKTLGQLFK